MLCRCGNTIPPQRANLGFRSCKPCGERAAQVEIAAKRLRVAPDGNKQGYSYQGSPEVARERIKTAGKKNSEIASTASDIPLDSYAFTPGARAAKVRKRRVIGTYYVGGEAYVWFQGDDPDERGATTKVRFE